MSTSTSLTVPTSFGDIPVTVDLRGDGRPVVILHGGAGPASVTGFADLLAAETHTQVIVPTHPGFDGTPRPETLSSIDGLAELYAGLLGVLGLDAATVIGNSIGGWITLELALRHPAQLGRIVLVDSVGVEVTGHPVAGALPPAELIRHSWFDPSKAPSLDPQTMSPAARELFAGNRAALGIYGGGMTDPTLLGRLEDIDVPALVVWGEADRIAGPEYGRGLAASIPGAEFRLLLRTGHVPQLETPHLLLQEVTTFVS